MAFPQNRLRRLRGREGLRRMVRETTLSTDDLIWPAFVRPGRGERRPVASMPGVLQYSTDTLLEEAQKAEEVGVPAILLFGIPSRKDPEGQEACDPDGVIPTALRALRERLPELICIADICLCEFTDHGHCGLLRGEGADPTVDNDATLERLARSAVVCAEAGADVLAPSAMMDGQVGAIRKALDGEGFADRAVLAYAAKFASAYYGPFRDAAESPPRFGDRTGYQMDPANGDEALREVALDLEEGADIVMVKPAMAYLDVVRRVKDRFGVPVAAYNVSGEYAMVKAAAEKGWIDERRIVLETLLSMRRAGADLILTYWAREVATWLRKR